MMNKTVAMVMGCAFAALAAFSARAADMDVGAAVQDPSKIPAMLGDASDADKSTFLKQVVDAASKLPVDPQKRPAKIADLISAGIGAMPAESMPQTLASTVCSVPFSLLPATIDALIPEMRARTAAMSPEDFQDTLDAAVAAVGDQGLAKDDADIYRAYIIALFAKLPADGDNQPIIDEAIAKVPDASRDDVAKLVAAAMKDDYPAIFGPEGAKEVIPVTHPEGGYALPHLDEVGGHSFGHADTHAEDDAGLERPSIIAGTGPAKPQPKKPRPPKPPKYKGQ